jgi:hypothetical protein
MIVVENAVDQPSVEKVGSTDPVFPQRKRITSSSGPTGLKPDAANLLLLVAYLSESK